MKKIKGLLFGMMFSLLFTSLVYGDKRFQSALTHYPRLTFDGRDSGHIQRTIQRLQQGKAPWITAYKDILGWAKNQV